jgi:hypothetical protein
MRGAGNEWDGGVPQYLMERLMMQPGPLQGALWTAILCAIAGHHELGGRPGVCKDQDCRRERKGTCRCVKGIGAGKPSGRWRRRACSRRREAWPLGCRNRCRTEQGPVILFCMGWGGGDKPWMVGSTSRASMIAVVRGRNGGEA